MSVFMKVVFVSVSITIGATKSQPVCPSTAMTGDSVCGNLWLCDGFLVPGGHLGNSSPVFNNDLMTLSSDFRILHCAAPVFAKDPCLSNPCKWNVVCFPHPLNMGYDCQYAFGTYYDPVNDRGQAMRIGTVDSSNRFQLFSLPLFQESGPKVTVSPPDPDRYEYPSAAHDNVNQLVYVARNDKLYGGATSGNFKLLKNLSGYAGIGRGGGIFLDYNSTWLYIAYNADKYNAIIKRYRIPSLDQEEIIYQTEPKSKDKAIWKGPSALTTSHTHRFLFWFNSLGIKRCDLSDCGQSVHRIYNFPKQIPPLQLQIYQLVVDDTNAKIFWSETVGIPDIQNIYVAEFDGTLVETVWEGSESGETYLTSIAGWLIMYDYGSRCFWYTRVASHVSESNRRAVLGWRWNRAEREKGGLSMDEMIPVY